MKKTLGKLRRSPKAAAADNQKPLYLSISEQLRTDIEAHHYTSGERLPPDAELAKHFSTSRLTVIRALRCLESEGLVTRKAGSGTFVRQESSEATRVFGLLMPDLSEGEVFEPISRSIARAGEALHHTVLWGESPKAARDKEHHAEELCRYLISRKVAGVFYAPVELTPNQDKVNLRMVANLDRAGIVIVLVDRCFLPFPDRSRYDLVGIDNRRAGYRMTRQLMDAGRERIAFAFRPGSAATVEARFAGYREALWVRDGNASAALPFSFEGDDREVLSRFLTVERPGGIVCANDLTAANLMHSLLKLGVRIPEDISMVGINDVKYASFLPIPLTTLRQPCQQIGAAAMRTMIERLDHPDLPTRDVLLDCELIVRQSCAGTGQTAGV